MSRIATFVILVPEYEAGLAFYRDCLGFKVVADQDMGEDKRWLVLRPSGQGGADLLIAKAEGPQQLAAIGNQAGGRVGFFLETEDFARDHAAFVARGVVFEESPRHEPYGIVAVFRDPFGNRWDLIEPKSGT